MVNQEANSLYNQNAETLIDHYKELVDQTRSTLFPLWHFSWIALPKLEGMSKSQVQLAEMLAPYMQIDTVFSSFGARRVFSFFLWFVLFLLWMALFIGYVNQITPELSSPLPSETQPAPLNIWARILIAILFILPPLLLYGYTVWFLTTWRNSWKTKVLWSLSLLIFLYYTYSQIRKVSPSETNALVTSPLFEFVLFFLLIPATLYIALNFLYWVKLFIELIANALNAFVYAHHPVSFQVLRKVVTNHIKSERGLDEIAALKELASSNLEATEKKTIPTVIMIGVFGFLTTVSTFQNFFAGGIQDVLSWIVELITGYVINITFGGTVFGVTAIVLIILFLAANIALFQNLFVQGIIVQACTIAEYAHKQTRGIVSPSEKKSSFVEIALRKIISVLAFLFGR